MRTRGSKSRLCLTIAACVACSGASAVESQSTDHIVDFLEQHTKGEFITSRFGNLLIVTAPASEGQSPALHQNVTVDFSATPIADVAQFIRDISGLNVVCAPGVLVSDKSVTFKAGAMRLGHVLKWIGKLTEFDIGWVDGALYISDASIQRPPQTRIYDVSDLVMRIEDFPGPEIALFEKPLGR